MNILSAFLTKHEQDHSLNTRWNVNYIIFDYNFRYDLFWVLIFLHFSRWFPVSLFEGIKDKNFHQNVPTVSPVIKSGNLHFRLKINEKGRCLSVTSHFHWNHLFPASVDFSWNLIFSHFSETVDWTNTWLYGQWLSTQSFLLLFRRKIFGWK